MGFTRIMSLQSGGISVSVRRQAPGDAGAPRLHSLARLTHDAYYLNTRPDDAVPWWGDVSGTMNRKVRRWPRIDENLHYTRSRKVRSSSTIRPLVMKSVW